jgi:hypothetical protein
MTTQSIEPDRPQWTNSYERLQGTTFYVAGGGITVSADSPLLLDPTDREVEMPSGARLFEHFAAVAGNGGIVYLTRGGRRVAAVVPADVAESLDDGDRDFDPQAALQELLDDYDRRNGPIPPEIAAEVDRQWAAGASL